MCMDRLDLDRGAGLRTSFSSLSLPHTRIFTGYLRIYMHLLASRGVKNSECLGVASSHDKGGALLSLPKLDLPPSMRTAVLSVLSVDEDKPSRRQTEFSAMLPYDYGRGVHGPPDRHCKLYT